APLRALPRAPGLRPGRVGTAAPLQRAPDRAGAARVPRRARGDGPAARTDDRVRLAAARVALRRRELPRGALARDLRRARARPRRADRPLEGGAGVRTT